MTKRRKNVAHNSPELRRIINYLLQYKNKIEKYDNFLDHVRTAYLLFLAI